MTDEPGQFEVPDGGLGAIKSNREPVSIRMLMAPYGRANTTTGVFTIPSHTWVDVGEMLIRHELGCNARVLIDATRITFLTTGEWQFKLTYPSGASVRRGLNSD